MTEAIIIPTERERLFLRQLATNADDATYFQAVDANRSHLSHFGDVTSAKYPDLESVRKARLHPENPNRLRFGIYNNDMADLDEGLSGIDEFVGSINLTPNGNSTEIGYWIDRFNARRGFATLATRALVKYAKQQGYPNIFAEVAEGNYSSARVLHRTGFTRKAYAAGKFIFTLDS